MKQFDPTEKIGVAAVAKVCFSELGWVFRETPSVDLGIDGQIELVCERFSTGKLIGVQIKTGESYIHKASRGDVYYGKHADLDYWAEYSLPVIMVFHNPTNGVTRWVSINDSSIERSEHGWSVIIPEMNIFGLSCKVALEALFGLSPNNAPLTRLSLPSHDFSEAQDILELSKEVVRCLMLDRWDYWVQGAACDHIAWLPEAFVDGVRLMRFNAKKFIYPENFLRERNSILNLVDCASKLTDRFLARAEYIPLQKAYVGVHTYKRVYPNINYLRDEAEHKQWAEECVWLVHELAKAANLFGDVIREGLDRNFIRRRGRFLVSDDFQFGGVEPNYSDSEKSQILAG